MLTAFGRAGNAQFERTLLLPSLRVESVRARDPVLQHLADMQVRAMQLGYDQHSTSRDDYQALRQSRKKLY